MKKPKGILAFDIDGTLTPRNKNRILPSGLPKLLNELDTLRYFSVLITGKSAPYAKRILKVNEVKDKGTIAENAGVYCKPGRDEIIVYGKGVDKIASLKRKIKINSDGKAVQNIEILGEKYEVAVDPRDVSIITFFTDPDYLNSRWKFKKSINAEYLYKILKKLVIKEKWQNHLEILKPYPDKAVQVIRKDSKMGKSIDKSCLPQVIKNIYNIKTIPPIIMFGDGHNDIPAMRPKEVFTITFSNAEADVKIYVRKRKGFISGSPAPEDLGIAESLYWITNNNKFFGSDGDKIKRIILNYFPKLKT